MLGYLQEHGPYVMEDETDFFIKNEYSWNKEVNMLYIESPAGVGFSYCEDMSLCNFNDETSSLDNLEALISFFAKFPEYRGHDLYLSGESYAGVYVPYLAMRIDDHNKDAKDNPTENKIHINLKGIIVGNGVTNWKWDGDQSYIEMAHYHNIYGTELLKEIRDNKCDYYYIEIDPNESDECYALYNKFKNLTSKVNVYDIYRKCYSASGPDGTHVLHSGPSHGQVEIGDEVKTYRRHYTTKDYTPWAYKK